MRAPSFRSSRLTGLRSREWCSGIRLSSLGRAARRQRANLAHARYVKYGNLYFVCSTKKNANVMMIFVFIHKLIEVPAALGVRLRRG